MCKLCSVALLTQESAWRQAPKASKKTGFVYFLGRIIQRGGCDVNLNLDTKRKSYAWGDVGYSSTA